MGRIDVGVTVETRQLEAIDGSTVRLPDSDSVVHLQFRRFAGCPICHLHVHQLAARIDEITAAGIREVVVFHSDADALRKHQNDLPFAVIADPSRALYDEFGVTSSIRAILNPRTAVAGVKGMVKARSMIGALDREDHLGRPADFLIDRDGTVLASKYGAHADDQWSVDELLALR